MRPRIHLTTYYVVGFGMFCHWYKLEFVRPGRDLEAYVIEIHNRDTSMQVNRYDYRIKSQRPVSSLKPQGRKDKKI